MSARHVVAAAALAFSAAPHVGAQGAVGQRHERTVTPGARGPNRLAVDSALLVGASPLGPADGRNASPPRTGLGELRLHDDARGVEVPYLYVWPAPAAPNWLGTTAVAVTPRKDTSGFEMDFSIPRTIDRFEMPELRERLLKRVRLEGSTDRVHWIVLVAEGTLFNLPAEGDVGRPLRQTELAFPPATVRFVRLTADDHAGAPLPVPRIASVRLVTRDAVELDTLRSALSFDARPRVGRMSRYHVRLPASRLPIVALELDAGGAQILRLASVTEPRLGNGRVEPVPLGQALLRRTTLGDAVAADLRIPIRSPDAPELDLVIDDGDNPPLDLRGVRAVYGRLPFIYFESAAGGELRVTYGADRRTSVAPPRYDLEALRDTVQRIAAATATWGPARAGAAPAAVAEVPSTLHAAPGAPLDVRGFRFARALPAGAGLTAVRLDPAVLAHSRIEDVRVLDPQGRQLPYLLERLDEPTLVPLGTLEPVQPRRDVDARVLSGAGAMTWYRLSLPLAGLPNATLRLATSARVFDRELAVVTRELPRDAAPQHAADRAVTAQWTHDDPESPTPPIEIALGGRRLTGDSLFVVVNDGDNQKLPLAEPTLLLPTYRLRFFRQAGVPLTLAYGRADLSAPRYDLQLIAPQLLDAVADEIVATPEPGAAPVTRMPQAVFWAVLGAAVLVLLGLIARLMRTGPPVADDATV